MKAVVGGHIKIVQLLLDAGANANIKNKNGSTALDLARLNEYSDIVKLLE